QAAWAWRHWAVDLPHTLVLAAADGSGRLVGLCQTSVRSAEGAAPAGAVDILAVAPAEQGRGLGRALLAWGVHHLREAGVGVVELTVNGANEGALRIYERAGFARAGARERWGHPTA
ncbi:MAG: GNAT family N-acetyltransferase, partial [Polyangiales bacterium]